MRVSSHQNALPYASHLTNVVLIHSTLRFLGWLSAERQITPGLGVFCRAALSQWVEDYLKALAEKGLKYSTLANYCVSHPS